MFESLFEENKKAPKRTVVYFSRSRSVFRIVCYSLFVIFGIYVFFKINYFLAIVIIIVPVLNIYKNLELYKNRTAQLSISDKGITDNNGKFRSWSGIKNEIIVSKANSNGKRGVYLSYYYHNTNEKIPIGGLDISVQKLNYLLRIYRKRSQKNQKK